MNIHIIGVPVDMGAGRRGVDMGPSAIRYTGLSERIRQLGHTVTDEGNLSLFEPEGFPVGDPHLKYLEPILTICERLAHLVEGSTGPQDLPLVIGGDHSLALGSITGVVKARQSVGVIWIDAHADFNTEQTTPSGNIHGMPLAALAGLGAQRLVNFGGFSPKIAPGNIAIVAARDLDPGERALLRQTQVRVFTMKDIDHLGMPETIAQALEIATSNTQGVHVSFDMDSLDPVEAPGVGTPVRGGITYREAHLAMELIADSGKLTSLDMVEVNPILDRENRTAELAVELILSALGKRIF
jgi:arginase